MRMSQAIRWFKQPQGGRQGGISRAPFAPSLWGCLKRFACSVDQSLAFGTDFEDVSSDSLVSALLRGAAGGGFTGSRSRHFVGVSQAVWPFSCPTSLAFGADFEDVSSDSLVSAL